MNREGVMVEWWRYHTSRMASEEKTTQRTELSHLPPFSLIVHLSLSVLFQREEKNEDEEEKDRRRKRGKVSSCMMNEYVPHVFFRFPILYFSIPFFWEISLMYIQ